MVGLALWGVVSVPLGILVGMMIGFGMGPSSD
jgi:hypothetical protein